MQVVGCDDRKQKLLSLLVALVERLVGAQVVLDLLLEVADALAVTF